jgi:hypothetical protein
MPPAVPVREVAKKCPLLNLNQAAAATRRQTLGTGAEGWMQASLQRRDENPWLAWLLKERYSTSPLSRPWDEAQSTEGRWKPRFFKNTHCTRLSHECEDLLSRGSLTGHFCRNSNRKSRYNWNSNSYYKIKLHQDQIFKKFSFVIFFGSSFF